MALWIVLPDSLADIYTLQTLCFRFVWLILQVLPSRLLPRRGFWDLPKSLTRRPLTRGLMSRTRSLREWLFCTRPFKSSRSRSIPEAVRDDDRYETISSLVCDPKVLHVDRVLNHMTSGRSTNLFLISNLFWPFRGKPESRHTPFVAFLDLKSETKTP
jgi:hypothetical protein